MKCFDLAHNFEYDITRPVNDMAAFFAYSAGHTDTASLRVGRVKRGAEHFVAAEFIEAGKHYCSEQRIEQNNEIVVASGETIRCLKLAVVDVFSQAYAAFGLAMPSLPWGVLTGVRPGKLAHKLLDTGAADKETLVRTLAEKYLLPDGQGQLLKNICLLQKQLLPDATRFVDGGIYIGVPFCPSRCTYCSFPAGIVPADEESQENFVNLIEQDVKNVVQLLGMHSLNIKSIYIGGGTPTSLGERPFARLLDIVEHNLLGGSVSEFTVEAGRPDCFTAGKLQAMERAGVNRVSVNPQTFHDRTLALIGRRHSVADFYRAYDMVRQSSIPVINMDLIIGLPEETETDIAYSLKEAAKLAPDNLTIHTLTLKRSAPLFGTSPGLSGEAAARMVEQGRRAAAGLGMVPYYLYRQHYMLGHLANIGYALPGTESLYNIQMMEERHPIIGVGPGSASKMPLRDGHHLNKLNMPKSVQAYAENLNSLFEKRAELFK